LKASFYKPNFDLLKNFPNPSRFDVVRTVKVKTDTLDSQLTKHAIQDIDYIKLDVQGHELAILKGGERALQKAIAIEVEVEFAPIYIDQPLFTEIDAYLNTQGFVLAAFPNLETWKHGNREQLIWADALYLKNPDLLDRLKRNRLTILRKVLLPSPRDGAITFKTIKTMNNNRRHFIKKALASLGLYHPALGVKISPDQKAGHILNLKPKDITTFVETGTNTGVMLGKLKGSFEKIYSIELDPSLYSRAIELFKDEKHIHLVEGDSADKLKIVLEKIDEPSFFWLDAHGSGTITGRGENPAPILKELELVLAHPIQDHIILVDDARHFDRWTISVMKKLSRKSGYTVSMLDGLFLVQK